MKRKINLVLILLVAAINNIVYAQEQDARIGFDTAINGIAYDADAGFAVKQIFGLSDKAYIELEKQALRTTPAKETAFDPIYFIFNDRYLMAKPELDGGGYFELGYTNKEVLKRRHCIVKTGKRLVTNNNIELGMSENDFQKSIGFKWGKFYLIRPNISIGKKTYTVYYHFIEGGGNYEQQFAGIKNRPSYIARYVFCNGKLIKFGFGNLPYHPTHEFEDVIE